MTEWAVYQYDPGLPAEGDSPEIPGSPPVLLARGFRSQEEADEAVDERFGDLFDVGTARMGGAVISEDERHALEQELYRMSPGFGHSYDQRRKAHDRILPLLGLTEKQWRRRWWELNSASLKGALDDYKESRITPEQWAAALARMQDSKGADPNVLLRDMLADLGIDWNWST